MLSSFKIIDLTQCINPESPSWDLECGFKIEEFTLDYFTIQHLNTPAGIGTHMDAPLHCCAQGASIDQLAIESLITECLVVDVSTIAHENFRLSPQHLSAWEERHGKIKAHSLVIIHAGWGRFFGDRLKYHNNLKFPTLTAESAEFLLERNIAGLGVDTLSPDGPEQDFRVHRLLLGAQKYIIENIADADKLPPTGSLTLALPLKIKNASEAPMRLVAFVPKNL